MYKTTKPRKTSIKVNASYVGETIEQKINRIVNNKEPIKDGAPIIYTERKDGVRPEHNIRTDKWDLALEKMDYVAKTHLTKREERIAEQAKKGMEAEAKSETKKDPPGGKTDGGAKPTQATDQA